MPSAVTALLTHRDFFAASLSRGLVVLGAEMAQVAVAYEVYTATHDPLSLGLLGFAQFLPVFLFAIPAGHAADRFSRVRLAGVGVLGVAACIWGLTALHRDDLPVIMLLMGVVGTLRAFAGPAYAALIAALIPDNAISRLSAMNTLAMVGAIIAGPAVGGVILAAFDANTVYRVSAVVVALALVGLLVVRDPGVPEGNEGRAKDLTLSSALDGLRFIWRVPALGASIALDFVAVFLGGVTALLPVYAVDILYVGPVGLGVLRAAPAIGAGLMGLALSVRPLKRQAGKALLVCVAVFGVATIVFGFSRWFPLSLAMLSVLGAADMVSMIVRGALLQVFVPTEWRGRVSAVNSVFIGASNELGELESGVAARLFGATGAVFLGGVGAIITAVACGLLVPSLWRHDRLDRDEPPNP